MNQDQRSVTDQLRTLIQVANREGLYDAADWLTRHLEETHRRAEEKEAKRRADGGEGVSEV